MHLYRPPFSFLKSPVPRTIIASGIMAGGFTALQLLSPLNISALQLSDLPGILTKQPLLLIPPAAAIFVAISPKPLSRQIPQDASASSESSRRSRMFSAIRKRSEQHPPQKVVREEANKRSVIIPPELSTATDKGEASVPKDSQLSGIANNATEQKVTVMETKSEINPTLLQAKHEESPQTRSAEEETAMLSEIVDSKVSAITEELSKTKNEFGAIRSEIDSMKSELLNMTSTIETSLVELKAFQAEMVNPMNFMRQYFETLELKNLSDPSQAFRPPERTSDPIQQPKAKPTREVTEAKSYDANQVLYNIPADSVKDEITIPSQNKSNHSKNPSVDIKSSEAENMRDVFAAPMSPSRMMAIVELVDEVLVAMGPEGVTQLVDQYKLLGLKKEDELLIYNVLKMLNDSKMMTDDVVAILYRFGQVLGINDKDAELHYMRIIANKKRPMSKSEVRRG